jgi:hypothetical protein
MYSRNGGDCNSKPKNASEVYSHNIYFNGNVGFQGANDVVVDPQFVNLTTDFSLGDFNLKSTSPAIDKGLNTVGLYSKKDIKGVARPQGLKPDIGAYEVPNSLTALIISSEKPTGKDVVLYPNPVSKVLSVKLPDNLYTALYGEIVDARGIPLIKQTFTNQINHVDIGHLSAGLYFIVITENNQVLSVNKVLKL